MREFLSREKIRYKIQLKLHILWCVCVVIKMKWITGRFIHVIVIHCCKLAKAIILLHKNFTWTELNGTDIFIPWSENVLFMSIDDSWFHLYFPHDFVELNEWWFCQFTKYQMSEWSISKLIEFSLMIKCNR